MPQTDSAKKALRSAERRRAVNDHWRQAFRRSVKAVQKAIVAGDATGATAALVTAQKNLDRAARRNIIHPNVAARKKSRLSRAIAKIGA